MTDALIRPLWACFETVHSVVYFSPHARDEAAALGLKGYWMGYFALRAAPLGPVGPAVVTAVCYGFHPRRVARAVPDAWRYATPEQALDARARAARAALGEAFGPAVAAEDVAAAADLLWDAASHADVAGRPLAAANRALPRPDDPVVALWQAATVLREHRGDGHNAVLVAHGVTPAEAHLIKIAAGETDADLLKLGRGFDEGEWAAAGAALRDRGWLDAAGALTETGAAEHAAVERTTDRTAAGPWRALGPGRSAHVLRALRPLAAAVAATGLIPSPGPVGLPRDVAAV